MAKYDQKILEELKIQKDKHIVLKINKSFIELAMNANGKADLYFHAYFWEQYLKSLDVMQAAIAMIEKEQVELLLHNVCGRWKYLHVCGGGGVGCRRSARTLHRLK